MKKYLFFLLSIALDVLSASAQSAGDYRSATSGNWSSASTWEIYDGSNWVAAAVSPDPALTLLVSIRNGHHVTVNTPAQSTADITVSSGGSLTLNANFTLNFNASPGEELQVNSGGNLSLSGGTLGGTGRFRILGTKNWGSGILDMQGSVASGGVLNVTSSVTLQDIITIDGIANHTSGSIFFQNGTLIINNIWNENPASNNQFGNTSGTNLITITASGVFNKLGPATFINRIPMTIIGLLDVENGVFNLSEDCILEGDINIETPGDLDVSNSLVIEEGSEVTGEGDCNCLNGCDIIIEEDELIMGNIRLIISAGGTLDADTDGELVIAAGEDEDDLVINGGTVSCPIRIETGANANLTASFNLQDIFTINGTVNHTGGSIFFLNGQLFINGTWNENPSGSNQFGNSGGVNLITISSAGTMVKQGTSTTTQNVSSNTTGLLDVQTGLWVVGGTSIATFTDGNLNIEDAGIFQLSATANFDENSDISGEGDFSITTGTLVVFGEKIFTDVNLNVSGGTINEGGSGGQITLVAGENEDDMVWSGGTLNCPLTVGAGGNVNIPGGAPINLDKMMIIDGIMTWQGQNMNFRNGTLLINGSLNLNSTGSSQFNNTMGTNSLAIHATGMVTKNETTSFSNNIPSANDGVIDIVAGTFTQQQTFTNRNRIKVRTGSTWTSNAATILDAGTVFEGTGIVKQVNQAMQFNTNVVLPDDMDFELSGFGKTAGTGSLTTRGTLIWGAEIGSPVIVDPLSFMETIAGSNSVLKNTLTIKGTGEIKGGTAVSFQGGTINVENGGILKTGSNVSTPSQQFTNTSGINKIFLKPGSLYLKTGSNVFTNFVDTQIDNGAEVQVNDGIFAVFGGKCDINGKIAVDREKMIKYGLLSEANVNNGASITGTGICEFQGPTNFNTNFEFPPEMTLRLNQSTSWNSPGAHHLEVRSLLEFESGSLNVETNIGSGGNLTTKTAGSKNFTRNINVNPGAVLRVEGSNNNFTNSVVSIFGSLEFNSPGTPVGLSNTSGSSLDLKPGCTISYLNPSGVTNISLPGTLNGTTKGVGTANYNAAITAANTISPGFSPGIITINSSSPLLTDNTILQIEILNGSGPGTGHDQLQRNSNLLLDGTLNVVQTGSVPLGIYTIIQLTSGTISGSFDVVNLPAGYTVGQSATAVFVTKVVLPLHLLSFTARKKEDKIELNWQTATEDNTSHFEIERSAGMNLYSPIGRVNAAGNSTLQQDYRFTDLRPLPENNYYRLKMFDQDAKFTYSKIVKVELNKAITVRVVPNPANDYIIVEGADAFKKMELIDAGGSIIQKFIPPALLQPISIKNLKAGVYWLRLTNEEGTQTVKFVRQ